MRTFSAHTVLVVLSYYILPHNLKPCSKRTFFIFLIITLWFKTLHFSLVLRFFHNLPWHACMDHPNNLLCLTMFTLDKRCRLIPPHWSNIANPSMPSKPRWCTRFGWDMINYAFYVTTSKRGGEGQGDTQKEVRTERQTYIIVKTGRSTGIETTHLTRLGFSWRRTQSEFWWEK